MHKATPHRPRYGPPEKGRLGIWIDHRQAIIVSMRDGKEETSRIPSGMEKHVRFSRSVKSEDGSAEDQRDKQYKTHLHQFYDRVILAVGKSNSVLIMGPGEAKGEFADRLAMNGPPLSTVFMEATGKLTESQIVAEVRQQLGRLSWSLH